MVKYRYVWGVPYPIDDPVAAAIATTTPSEPAPSVSPVTATQQAALASGTQAPTSERKYEYRGKYYTEAEIKKVPSPEQLGPIQSPAEKAADLAPPAPGEKYIIMSYDPVKKSLSVPTKEDKPEQLVRIAEPRWTVGMKTAVKEGRPIYGTRYAGPMAVAAAEATRKRRVAALAQYEIEKQDYGEQRAAYEKYIAQRRTVESAAETWQAKLGHALSWEQIGGLKTAYEFIEQPALAYAKTRKGKPLSEPTYYWSKDYQANLKEQYRKLSEGWRERRIERTRLAYYRPKQFALQEAAGITITTAALLLPEVLPAAEAAIVARAPVGFLSLAKVPVGAVLAGFGVKQVKEAEPKVKEYEPGSTFELLTGAGLVLAGAGIAVGGAAEWARWRGRELMRPEPMGTFTQSEAKYQAQLKKYGAEARFGQKLEAIGKAPTRVKEFLFPPKVEYYTREVRGVEVISISKKERTGLLLETSTEYGGGEIAYGEVIGGKWYPSGKGAIKRITTEGTEWFLTRPVEHAGYKGLPKQIKSFDTIGFYGGELKRGARPELDIGEIILETRPTLQEVTLTAKGKVVDIGVQKISVEKPIQFLDVPTWKGGKLYERMLLDKGKVSATPLEGVVTGEDVFTGLIEKYPEKMFRIRDTRTFVGGSEFIGKGPGVLEVLPEGAELTGVTVMRFVEGPKEYKPFTFKGMSKKELESASLQKAIQRAFLKEQGYEGAVFGFELEAAGIETIGVGEGILIGETSTKQVVDVGLGRARPKPKYISAPVYTAQLLAPGEPSVLNVLPSAVSLGLVPKTKIPIRRQPKRAERKTFIEPRSMLGVKARVQPTVKAKPLVIIKPKVKAKPLVIIKPKVKAEPKVKPMPKTKIEPLLKPIIKPKVQPKIKALMKVRALVRAQPITLLVPSPVPRPRPTPIIIPSPKPSRIIRRKRVKKKPRLPRRLKRRLGKITIVPKADLISLTKEEMRLGKKAKHPPITKITKKEYKRRLHGPGAAVLRFPTARQYREIMKKKRAKKKVKSKKKKKKKKRKVSRRVKRKGLTLFGKSKRGVKLL